MAPSETAANAPNKGSALVLRNALVLVIAQVAAIPLSLVVNGVMGHYLGPDDFGRFFLITTYAGTAFLLVEWGQAGTLPALIAKARERAPVLLGSALAFRAVTVPFVFGALSAGMWLLGHRGSMEALLALFFIVMAIGSVTSACQDAVRGFERTDVAAYSMVGIQFATALFVIPVLWLGGQLTEAILAMVAANVLVLVFVWGGVRSTGIRRLSVDRSVIKQLAVDGAPFFFFSMTMQLQPMIDAVFLASMASEHAVGWHGAARKLIGVLVFPASALVQALYPTMCRLFESDREGYLRTARTALETSALAVVPLAVGCYLFADLGIETFGREGFAPAADNLRMFSPFIFMLYFSMPLGACILAAGKQRSWTLVQAMCIVTSVVFDPLLIPWFERVHGNGGLGVGATTLIAESLMVISGVVLMPKAVFDRQLLLGLLRLFVAGAAMFGAGMLLRNLSPFLAAPIVALVYLGSLRAIGGLKAEQLALFKDIVKRKASRTSAPPPPPAEQSV